MNRNSLAKNSAGMVLTDFERQVDMRAIRMYRLGRLQAALKAQGLPGILLADSINIRYASGVRLEQVQQLHHTYRTMYVSAERGCIAFSRGPGWRSLLPELETISEVRSSNSDLSRSGVLAEERARAWAKDIVALLREEGETDLRLPADRLPAIAIEALSAAGVRIIDGVGIMEEARKIKCPEEIQLFLMAISVGEAGAYKMREALRPGVTENEVFSILHQTNIAMGGEWCDLRLAASGGRTNPALQEHSHRMIRAGDLFTFDTDMIGPFGVYVDFSRTLFCGPGKPQSYQRDIYKLAVEQLEHNLELVKPGMTIREITEKSYRLPPNCVSGRYPLLMHGFGLTYDLPFVPNAQDFDGTYGDQVLEENMTLCVESLIAPDDTVEAVKLEQQVLVTSSGPQLLSTFPYEECLL
jgi:Xaa-Pro dipeptidase